MNNTNKRVHAQIEKHKQGLLDSNGDISLTTILESEKFQLIISGCREFRDRIYTPLVTLLIFIKQVLYPDKSCKRAVVNFISEQLGEGNEKEISVNTGPYCKARKRLPKGIARELVNETGNAAIKGAPKGWKIYGREVKAVDGTTAKMADTEANQQAYPQHGNQNKGAGFPIARLLIVVSLTVGTVVDYAIGAHKGKGTGEQSLFRSVNSCVEKNDILLGDRYYPSFFVMAWLNKIGADGIFRGQSQRCYDFRKGEKFGRKDHIVGWKLPRKPSWMSQEEYNTYPDEMRVREFKVNGVIYVTTFLNSKKYNKRELAKAYELRWHIEINIDSIKTVMNMDMLSCKTPEMVMKEIGIHFVAYNIIRILIAEACQKNAENPRSISFKGTIQILNSFMPYFQKLNVEKNNILYRRMLSLIVKNKIGVRPGRVEPRKIKQRRKPFKTLNRPRIVEQRIIVKKIEKRKEKYAIA